MFRRRLFAIKFKKFISIFVILYLMSALLLFPERSIASAKNALLLCANVLIPSLFSFFVFSSVLIALGFADLISLPMSKLMRPLFNVSGKGALCLVLGIISGYPLGAVCVCDMYKNGSLSKNEAQKLLAFCNNSGPLFIIGCVGTSLYQSRQIGFVLYIIHILSSILVGIILGRFNRKGSISQANSVCIHTSKPFGVILKDAITNSVNNILLVCGFTVVFAVIISSVVPFLQEKTHPLISLICGGFLEISQGTKSVADSTFSLSSKLILTSAITSFGGLSVHLQVSGIVSKTDLSTKTYYLGKVLQTIISLLFATVIFKEKYIPTYAQNMYPIRPYELIDFVGAIKLSLLYLLCAIFILLVFWAIEKICHWQEKIKHKR